MKAVAVTEFLLAACVLGIIYLVWIQGGQLSLLEQDVDTLRRQMSDLAKHPAPPPRAPRAPAKPKEKK